MKTVFDVPVISLNNDTLVCEQEQVPLVATVNGGIGPFNYLWNDGNTNSSRVVTVINNTTYSVTVTDEIGRAHV